MKSCVCRGVKGLSSAFVMKASPSFYWWVLTWKHFKCFVCVSAGCFFFLLRTLNSTSNFIAIVELAINPRAC